MVKADKAQLRRSIRASFPGDEERMRQSRALCRHILTWDAYREARVVGAYAALGMEADLTPLLRDALGSGKVLALPRVESKEHMTLRIIRSMEDMKPGRWGIPEPGEDAPLLSPERLELLIVPVEGVDLRGVRLGKGGGYYDRLLAKTSCMTAGAVLSWQWREEIPAQPWDQPLHAAVDQHGIHMFEPNGENQKIKT